MKITKVTCFPVAAATGKAKANGTVTVDDVLDLKYVLMDGSTGLFVSWAGGKKYTKKDGTPGWDSPIYIKDQATLKTITEQVVTKFKSVQGGTRATAGASASAQSNDASYAADDIPF